MKSRNGDETRKAAAGRFLTGGDRAQLPSWEAVREDSWNPDDRRVLTPRSFGWGYNLNLFELLARMGFIHRE